MRFASYLRTFAGCVTLGALAVISINALVDPWTIFGVPVISGINDLKPEVDSMDRAAKAVAIERLRPEVLVLGNSRAETGFHIDHAEFSEGRAAYNLAFSGGSIEAAYRFLLFAHRMRPIRRVFLNVDFDAFHESQTESRGYSLPRLEGGLGELGARIKGWINAAISWEALQGSFRTVASQRNDYPGVIIEPTGEQSYRYKAAYIRKHGGHAAMFDLFEGSYAGRLAGIKLDPASAETVRTRNLEFFGKLVQFGYANGIDMRITWSPVHARTLALYRAAGLSSVNESLKRDIVRIVREVALKFGKPPYPVVDYGRISSATTEPVPPRGDLGSMRFYTEGLHFSPALGRIILDDVYAGDDVHAPRSGFGVALTAADFQSAQSADDEHFEAWAVAHPIDVARAFDAYRSAERVVRTGKEER